MTRWVISTLFVGILGIGCSYQITTKGVTTLKGTSSIGTALVSTPPITITGQNNVVISGVRITNPSGPCITIDGGSTNITVQGSEIGPCVMAGVRIDASSNITVNSVYIHDTTWENIVATGITGLNITNNRLVNGEGGAFVQSSTLVVFEKNTITNVQGPPPRGQLVQFNNVSGPGNRVNCNVGHNTLGVSDPEDAINMFQSNGTMGSPIMITNNKIEGGGPSASGGGILMGDDGGSWQVAQGNILVNPGQYGISVASGTDMSVLDNQIYAAQQSFTNVGVSVWNQYPHTCGPVTVTGNQVQWTNSAGMQNPNFDGGGCGTIIGWMGGTNDWNAPINATIINQVIAACQ